MNKDQLNFRINVYQKMLKNNARYILRLKNNIRDLKERIYKMKRERQKLEDMIIRLSNEVEKLK